MSIGYLYTYKFWSFVGANFADSFFRRGFFAMQCSFCGSPLKEDARYCNQCGTLVASHPFSPKSSSAVRTSDTTDRTIREQIAQQPNRTSRRLQDEPPSWLSFVESGLRGKVPSGG